MYLITAVCLILPLSLQLYTIFIDYTIRRFLYQSLSFTCLSGTDVHRLFRPTSFYFLSFPHSSRSLNTNHSFRRIRHTRALFPLLRFFLLY